MILVGIDGGTTTGLAQWSTLNQVLGVVTSMPIHKAMDYVRKLPQVDKPGDLLVIVEDARLRKWFGRADAKQAKYGDAVREGAGAAKRDSAIWDDFLTDLGIPHLMQKPQATKRGHEWFVQVTGWQARTNEHARDAALLVYGMSHERAKLLLDTVTARQPSNPGSPQA